MRPDDQGSSPHLLYIADPMCSWCYGFSPVMNAVAGHFRGMLPVQLRMGGLRPGTTHAMRPQDKDYIRSAWSRVAAASGQPFDHAFFERDGFVYDTEPACRAVVAGRTIDADRALGLLAGISRAFYAGNRDTTDAAVLLEIAIEAGYDRSAVAEAFLAPAVRNATFADFLAASEMGVHGFPTLLISRGGPEYAIVTNGFRPIDGMIEGIERWLATSTPAAPG